MQSQVKQYNTFNPKNTQSFDHLLYNTTPAHRTIDTKQVAVPHSHHIVNHHLYWNNRFYISQHIYMLFATLALIIIPFIYHTKYVVTTIHVNSISYITAFVLLLLSCISLIQTSIYNPGIITQSYQHITNGSDDETTHNPGLLPQYCAYCNIVRPPRARHCRHCNVCVARFDHCCQWSGSNIGQGNYKYYLLFLLYINLLALLVSIQCAIILYHTYTVQHKTYPNDKLTELIEHVIYMQPITFILLLYCTVILISVFSLLLYHCSLIRDGVTTNERVRNVYNTNTLNPNHKSWAYLHRICCADNDMNT